MQHRFSAPLEYLLDLVLTQSLLIRGPNLSVKGTDDHRNVTVSYSQDPPNPDLNGQMLF